jgi:hypothetical protein
MTDMADAAKKDECCQAPQFPEDKHGRKYDNDVASNWLRGMGPKGAEGKPDFDHGKKGR